MQAALLGDDTEPQTLEINDYPSKEELLAALKD